MLRGDFGKFDCYWPKPAKAHGNYSVRFVLIPLLSFCFVLVMSSGTPSVTLQDLHSDDAEQVVSSEGSKPETTTRNAILKLTLAAIQVKGNWAAFPSFYHDVEPVAKRSNEADRLRRCVARMQQLIDSPNTLARKAVMDGKLVGIALWFRPGAPIFNEKRRLKSSSSDEDELWIGLGSEWEDKWAAWDTERARIMGDTPHCEFEASLEMLRRGGPSSTNLDFESGR